MAPDNNRSGTSTPPGSSGGSGTSAMDVDIDTVSSDMCKVEEKAPPSWFERMLDAVMRAIGMRDAAQKRADAERCLEDPNRPGGGRPD